MNILLQECILALGNDVVVFDEKASHALIAELTRNWPLTVSGALDWTRLRHETYLDADHFRASAYFRLNDTKPIFILADIQGIPILKTSLCRAIDCIDDVAALSVHTYLTDTDLIIEQAFPTDVLRVWKEP